MQTQVVRPSYAWSDRGIPTDLPHCRSFFSTVSLSLHQELWYVSWSRPPHFHSPNKLKLVIYSKKRTDLFTLQFSQPTWQFFSLWSNYSAYIAVNKVPNTGFSLRPKEKYFVYFKITLLGRIKFKINFFARLIWVLVCSFSSILILRRFWSNFRFIHIIIIIIIISLICILFYRNLNLAWLSVFLLAYRRMYFLFTIFRLSRIRLSSQTQKRS